MTLEELKKEALKHEEPKSIIDLVDEAYQAGQQAQQDRCLQIITDTKLVEFSVDDAEIQEAIKLHIINLITSKE